MIITHQSYRLCVTDLADNLYARTRFGDAEALTRENGTTNNSTGVVMTKVYFDNMTNPSNVNYNVAIHTYYNNLLTSDEEPYKSIRDTYAAWYSYTPQTMYDVYIMTHMMKTNAGSGVVFTAMNRGKQLTDVKGKVFTVTYNYTYVPAYPPEYNALHYGNVYNAYENTKFKQGFYYHPEPGDLGVFLRDDMLAKCNSTWAKVSSGMYSKRTPLSNSTYLGSVAESYSSNSWYFYGAYRCLNDDGRYYSNFRSRPCSAYLIS